MSINTAFDQFYNDVVYKNVGHCSNLPEIKGKFIPPFPQNLYEIKNCEVDVNGFPDIMPIGYYKLILVITGQVNMSITLIAKLTTKLL